MGSPWQLEDAHTWCEYLLSLESKTPDGLRAVEIQSAPRSHVNVGIRSELRLTLLMWLQMSTFVGSAAVGDAGRRSSLCRNSHCPGRASTPCWIWAQKADSPPQQNVSQTKVPDCGGNWLMSGGLHSCYLWVVYLSRVVTCIV